MKKILLSISAIAALTAGNAQIYSANNSAGFGAWSGYDLDMDTYNWGVVDLTSSGTALASQGECLTSNSWVSAGGGTPLTPNNLAVSPAINCATAVSVTLNFGVGSVETTNNWWQEHYAVYVVNATQLAAALTGTYPTPVQELTLPSGGAMLPQSLNITTQAAGQSEVYIIFRHFNCTDMNFLVVDDLTVTGQFATVEENTLTVSAYPNPAVDVLNLSFNAQVQNVNIYGLNGQIVYTVAVNATTVELDVTTLAPGAYFYEAITSEGNRVRNTFIKK